MTDWSSIVLTAIGIPAALIVVIVVTEISCALVCGALDLVDRRRR